MIAYLLTGAGAAALVMFGASITWPVAYRAGRKATVDDTRIVDGVRALTGNYPTPIHRRLSDTITHPEPMWEAEEVPAGVEGYRIGIRFQPPELLAPTEKVFNRHREIKSHRAPEGWRTLLGRLRGWLVGLVERARAWPLEPSSSFADWWRRTEHQPHHALGAASGAATQVARWNVATGEYPAVGLDTEWDREMEQLVEEDLIPIAFGAR